MRYCPRCHSSSTVLETRERTNGEIRRRRKCLRCPARWSTEERMIFGSLNLKKTVRTKRKTGSGR